MKRLMLAWVMILCVSLGAASADWTDIWAEGFPDWTVDVTFAGPVVTSGDSACEAAWMLCTLFFCDYSASSWTAKLRVRDNHTGRLAFHCDYVQRYETKVFGLIPVRVCVPVTVYSAPSPSAKPSPLTVISLSVSSFPS